MRNRLRVVSNLAEVTELRNFEPKFRSRQLEIRTFILDWIIWFCISRIQSLSRCSARPSSFKQDEPCELMCLYFMWTRHTDNSAGCPWGSERITLRHTLQRQLQPSPVGSLAVRASIHAWQLAYLGSEFHHRTWTL